jgi:NAD(P)H dehydrogenase (quinone)
MPSEEREKMSPPAVEHRIILAHPDPESFCGSVAQLWMERAQRHHQTCTLRDLYAERFDPVLKSNERPGKADYAPPADILQECDRLAAIDVLVLVYPMWFGGQPAMLKGYLERVLGNAALYVGDEPHERPLSGTRLVQISTSATTSSWLAEKGVESAMHTLFDRYLAEVLGAERAYRLHLDAITEGMSYERGNLELEKVKQVADKVCADANAARWARAQGR